ncbi:MAG: N-acetylmuramoyl-L-alanine amidase [Mangrovibacterium sp.]
MKNLILTLLVSFLLAWNLQAQEHPTFVAKNGDTVYSILRENNLSPGKYVSIFKELNKGKFTANNGLFIGVKYKIPLAEEENSTKKKQDATKTEQAESKAEPANSTPREYRTVVAKSGDGISIILNRNGLPPSKYTTEFIALNEKNIGKNQELFIGRTYKLPFADEQESTAKPSSKSQSSTGKKLYNSLYGAEYRNFDQVSNKLDGTIYYLISGHGGPDPGAHGYHNGKSIYEDEYAYDVTLRLARELESHGAKVYMIIHDASDGIRDDVYLPADKNERCFPNNGIPLNQVRRLKQRTDAVNELYKRNKGSYQRCIITHIDSRGKNTPIDAFFYYDERSTGGKKMAQNLYNTLDSKYKNRPNPREYHGTVSTRSLYVLRNTLPVATFIELGNINYYRDIQRIVLKDNRQALANWLCEGLIVDYQQNKHNK